MDSLSNHPNIIACKDVLACLGIQPGYVIHASMGLFGEDHQYAFDTNPGATAFTSPVADLMFRDGVLRYAWQGRGFATVFIRSPADMSKQHALGTLIHELGHFADWYDNPARSESDFGRAKQLALANAKPQAEYHGARWVRACVHCWVRATAAGYDIPSECLQLAVPGYYPGSGTAEQYISALRHESAARVNEPVEKILASPLPPALAKYFPGQPAAKLTPVFYTPTAGGTAATPTPTTGSRATTNDNALRPALDPKMFVCVDGAGHVEFSRDGRVRELSKLVNGKIVAGKVWPSRQSFYRSLDSQYARR